MDLIVDEHDAGRRLDQLLGEVAAVGSRSNAERLLRDGMVTVNGSPVAKSFRLKARDVVVVADSALVAPEPVRYASVSVPILWQDDALMIVDKPLGVVVHPAPGHQGITLVEMLESSGITLAPSDDEMMHRPGVVHRLDKDTSGVILLAKTAESLRELQNAMRARTIRREYLALVHGHMPSRAGRIEAPIGRDYRDTTRQSIDSDRPRDAITHFVVTEILADTMLLRLRLETGRTHQIRVHLQSVGHPVVGDPMYGDSQADSYGLTRQFLHAARLQFKHPFTGEDLDISSPLPDDLTEALAIARRVD